jgi:hypothetical protein
MKTGLLVLLLLCAAPVFAHPTHHKKHAQPAPPAQNADGPVYEPLCCPQPFAVDPGSWVIAWQGEVNDVPDPRLVGSYSASGGAGNDIVVMIGSPIDVQNALSGHPAQLLYQSAKLTAGTFDVPLPGPGPYAIAFTNRFSVVSAKLVSADLALAYTPAP